MGMMVGVSAVALAGCAGLLGIEDRTADESDGSVDAAGGLLDHGSGEPDGAVVLSVETGAGLESGALNAPETSAPEPDAAAGGSDAYGASDTQGAYDVQTVPEATAPGEAGSCADPCPLKTGLNNPWAMASDANRVYWVEYGSDQGTADGVAASCPVSGCDSGLVVYTSTETNPKGIAVDDQNVYWGSVSPSDTNTGAIWSCPIAGCAAGHPTKLAIAISPWGIALDSSYVYWVDNDDNSVHRVPKTSGAGGVLAENSVLYDGVSGDTVEPQQCAVDATSVYFTDVNGSVYQIPITGGTPVVIGSGPRGSVNFGLALDSTSLYYAEPDAIFAERKTATNGGSTIVTDVHWAQGLTIDPATGILYWANSGSGDVGVTDGTVGRVGVDGTGETVLASRLVAPFGVTVSGNNVFWINLGNASNANNATGTTPNTGSLWRTAK